MIKLIEWITLHKAELSNYKINITYDSKINFYGFIREGISYIFCNKSLSLCDSGADPGFLKRGAWNLWTDFADIEPSKAKHKCIVFLWQKGRRTTPPWFHPCMCFPKAWGMHPLCPPSVLPLYVFSKSIQPSHMAFMNCYVLWHLNCETQHDRTKHKS